MNFFHRWCARIAKKKQEEISFEIKRRTELLTHARYCDDLCFKASQISSRYKGIMAPITTVFTKEDIEVLIRFVDLKVSGSRVEWGKVVADHNQWFIERGLPIPEITVT